MSRLLFLIAAGAVALSAQTPMGGPSLGFVFDAHGQALRPILGIPGASVFGDPLQPSSTIASASFSWKQQVAIVNDGAWKAIILTGSAPGVQVLPDGLPASAIVAVSESGAAAAFYDSANNALTVVTGIAPSTASSSSMTASPVSLDPLPGAITAMAAGDDGSLLLSSAVPGGGESLFWLGQDGSVRQLATLQATASIQLWNHGSNALVVDRTANQIWKIQDPGATAAITLLASDADGVSSPSGAALSARGNQLWIANAGARSVLGIDMNSRATVSLSCGFDLTTLVPMAGGQTFRLNELDSGPVWLLNASPGVDPRVVFVPALQAAATTTEAAQ